MRVTMMSVTTLFASPIATWAPAQFQVKLAALPCQTEARAGQV
jgi:hypothetical protein